MFRRGYTLPFWIQRFASSAPEGVPMKLTAAAFGRFPKRAGVGAGGKGDHEAHSLKDEARLCEVEAHDSGDEAPEKMGSRPAKGYRSKGAPLKLRRCSWKEIGKGRNRSLLGKGIK